MLTYRPPRNDISRLTFLNRSIAIAQQDIKAGNPYLAQKTLDRMIDLSPVFEKALLNVTVKLSLREKVTREHYKSLKCMKKFIRDFFVVLQRRVERTNQPADIG